MESDWDSHSVRTAIRFLRVDRWEDQIGKPLDIDLRRCAVAAVAAGLSTAQATKRFSVSQAAVGAWVRPKRVTGDVWPKPQGSGTGSVLDPHQGFILVLIEADKDITRVEIGKHLADTCGLRVVPATIWYWLDRRAITFKQNRARQRAAAPRGAAQARGDRNGGCRTPLPAAL